jgi:hypothetical protein
MATPLPPEWDSWLEEGARLLAAPPLRRNEQSTRGPHDPKFALGDFLLAVPQNFVEPLAEALSASPGQFRIYREVADKLAPAHRVAASWTVHRDLRERPDLLQDGLTVRAAAVRMGKQPIDSKPDRRLSLEERADKVRAGLADPDVFALIDNELAHSRTERQLRHRARQVHSEHTHRGRELETELRDLRAAKSPFEATVKAELDVNKAMQLVEAIGQTFDDLPQPERLLDALVELNTLIAAFILTQRASEDHDAPIVVEGEVWQARPARAALASSNQRDLPRDGRIVVDAVD